MTTVIVFDHCHIAYSQFRVSIVIKPYSADGIYVPVVVLTMMQIRSNT